MRESVAVLAPHSMSASFFDTRSKRFCAVAGIQFTFSPWILSCCSMLATTRLQMSTV